MELRSLSAPLFYQNRVFGVATFVPCEWKQVSVPCREDEKVRVATMFASPRESLLCVERKDGDTNMVQRRINLSVRVNTKDHPQGSNVSPVVMEQKALLHDELTDAGMGGPLFARRWWHVGMAGTGTIPWSRVGSVAVRSEAWLKELYQMGTSPLPSTSDGKDQFACGGRHTALKRVCLFDVRADEENRYPAFPPSTMGHDDLQYVVCDKKVGLSLLEPSPALLIDPVDCRRVTESS